MPLAVKLAVDDGFDPFGKVDRYPRPGPVLAVNDLVSRDLNPFNLMADDIAGLGVRVL